MDLRKIDDTHLTFISVRQVKAKEINYPQDRLNNPVKILLLYTPLRIFIVQLREEIADGLFM